jgi:hypothetical protein
MLLRALDRTSRQPFRCDVALKRMQAGAQLCQLFIHGHIFAQWTIELGPLIEATSYVRTVERKPAEQYGRDWTSYYFSYHKTLQIYISHS